MNKTNGFSELTYDEMLQVNGGSNANTASADKEKGTLSPYTFNGITLPMPEGCEPSGNKGNTWTVSAGLGVSVNQSGQAKPEATVSYKATK